MTIVVGVDGSEESNAAIRWAVEEARLRGTEVRAVHAWLYPAVFPPAPTVAPYAGVVPFDVLRDDAQEQLDTALAEAVPPDAGVQVQPVLAEGQPAEVLLEACADAELLVVGSRGRGGFAGLLLGSVSNQCAQHATCPVVIVRGGDEAHS
jgi:nucleotide-binding universal stress UspA family protein